MGAEYVELPDRPTEKEPGIEPTAIGEESCPTAQYVPDARKINAMKTRRDSAGILAPDYVLTLITGAHLMQRSYFTAVSARFT